MKRLVQKVLLSVMMFSVAIGFSNIETLAAQKFIPVYYKNADTEEVIKTEQVALPNNEQYDAVVAYDMEYMIQDEEGQTYLFDSEHSGNITYLSFPYFSEEVMEAAAEQALVLYYKPGSLKDGETAAEVYFWEGTTLLEKRFVTNLKVNEFYRYEPENIIREGESCPGGYFYIWGYSKNKLKIEALSSKPEENQIHVHYLRNNPGSARSVTVYQKDADTGAVIGKFSKNISGSPVIYEPDLILYAENGAKYQFDVENPENILKLTEIQGGAYYDQNIMIAWYLQEKNVGDEAAVKLQFLNAENGQIIKEETVSGLRTGDAYTYYPQNRFTAKDGVIWVYDEKNTKNNVTVSSLSGHVSKDIIYVYYRDNDVSAAAITVKNVVYNGKKRTPKVKVVCNGKTLVKDQDYKVVYKKNKNPGKAQVIIEGIGNYTGKQTTSFVIRPSKPKIKEVINKEKTKALVRYDKVKGADGYEITYAAAKKTGLNKTKSTKKTSVVLKKLKAGQKYQIRVRAYVKVNGKKVYSPYSKKRTVTLS